MLLGLLHFSQRRRNGLPVLPGALPLLGHTPIINSYSYDLFGRALQKLGPIYCINMGFGRWGVVCDGRPGLDLLRQKVLSSELPRRIVPLLVGVSLISQDGAVHAHMRSAMNEPFQPRALTRAQVGVMTANIMATHIDRWLREPRLPLLTRVRELALEIIFRIIGIDSQDLSAWEHQYREFLFGAYPIPIDLPGFPQTRGRRGRTWLTQRFVEIIDRERSQEPHRNLLSSLIHSRDEKGERMTNEELIDNLLFLVLAGHETIASALTWLTISLAKHPRWWGQLGEESSQLGAVVTTHQEFSRCPVAEALFRETVRLYPPILMVTRELTQEVTLYGHVLPAGTAVAIPIGHLARDPGLFQQPESFRPERWLANKISVGPLETCQFGMGPHFCLGYHLALLEGIQFAQTLSGRLNGLALAPRVVDGEPLTLRYAPFGQPPRKLAIEFQPTR